MASNMWRVTIEFQDFKTAAINVTAPNKSEAMYRAAMRAETLHNKPVARAVKALRT